LLFSIFPEKEEPHYRDGHRTLDAVRKVTRASTMTDQIVLSTYAKGEITMKKVLITGSGTGFGHEVAIRLAAKGFDVIAAVEIYAQVQTLKREAAARGVTLQVEKLDVTNDGDRRKALAWNVEILVNNAGVLEGGSVVDIPAFNIRREFEVNVVGPLLLTQGIAKQMVKRGKGRIVWVSSREGINVNPFTGIYSASKHAVEAIAETMSLELQEFGIEVATINPGPFLTGFNDRGFQTWQSWEDNPSERLYDYSKLAFPRAQFAPEPVYATMTAVAAGEIDTYRNLEPKSMLAETKSNIEAPWNKKVKDGLGTRPASLQKSYEMKPETPVSE
jgi:NAD(P)-dependent dehydrogenase (short-subunit alcohol dehydrogenase family)